MRLYAFIGACVLFLATQVSADQNICSQAAERLAAQQARLIGISPLSVAVVQSSTIGDNEYEYYVQVAASNNRYYSYGVHYLHRAASRSCDMQAVWFAGMAY